MEKPQFDSRAGLGSTRPAAKQSSSKFPINWGQYLITRQLGSGASGVVFQGVHQGLQREVAIKVLSPRGGDLEKQKKHFMEEARCMAQLEHPNLVPIYDVGEIGGKLYLAMKLMHGDLRQYILDSGRFDTQTALNVLYHLAGGLHELHEQGIIHRDLSPANLFYEESNIRIGDFGFISDPTSDEGVKRGSVGTPAYMSPETIKGDYVDTRTDIYSLGACMFFALTERRPFEGSNPRIQLRKVVNNPVPNVNDYNPAIHPELSDLIFRMMSKRPEDRPQTAMEVCRDCQLIYSAYFENQQEEKQNNSPGMGTSTGSKVGLSSLKLLQRVFSGGSSVSTGSNNSPEASKSSVLDREDSNSHAVHPETGEPAPAGKKWRAFHYRGVVSYRLSEDTSHS
ncbi:Hypothetical protein PBC10988_11870 [Planctomycetales bacterium 10988]|nr:Hypothetical protein PBC10988_11870 [Planctomycetales bacterium 10988]